MKKPITEKAREVRANVRSKVQTAVARVELSVISHGEFIEHNADGDYEVTAFEHLVWEVTELAIRG